MWKRLLAGKNKIKPLEWRTGGDVRWVGQPDKDDDCRGAENRDKGECLCEGGE